MFSGSHRAAAVLPAPKAGPGYRPTVVDHLIFSVRLWTSQAGSLASTYPTLEETLGRYFTTPPPQSRISFCRNARVHSGRVIKESKRWGGRNIISGGLESISVGTTEPTRAHECGSCKQVKESRRHGLCSALVKIEQANVTVLLSASPDLSHTRL